MNRRMTVWVGGLTTLLFLGIGISFLADGRTWVGGLVTGLGALRALVWVRQLQSMRTAE